MEWRTEQCHAQSTEHWPAVLPGGRDVAADLAKDGGAFLRPETAVHLLLELDQPEVALRLVVVKRRLKIVHIRHHLLPVAPEAIQQVLGLALPPALFPGKPDNACIVLGNYPHMVGMLYGLQGVRCVPGCITALLAAGLTQTPRPRLGHREGSQPQQAVTGGRLTAVAAVLGLFAFQCLQMAFEESNRLPLLLYDQCLGDERLVNSATMASSRCKQAACISSPDGNRMLTMRLLCLACTILAS